ncbi:MAG: hypothetical protein M1825_005036 [Sarcosagium campestre]|nr:MAG: hypothetical protein M1825_005036 [Sarcosagium campestre]
MADRNESQSSQGQSSPDERRSAPLASPTAAALRPTGGGVGKKRGPKRDSTAPSTRRQERNRVAQRLCRDRKEQYIQSLEQVLRRIQDENAELTRANDALKQSRSGKGYATSHSRSGSAIGSLDALDLGAVTDASTTTDSTSLDATRPPSSISSSRMLSPVGLDYPSLCLNFVLKLEHVCLDHIQPGDVTQKESVAATFGHSLMLSAPTLQDVEKQNESSSWDPSRGETREMLNKLHLLSSQLNLTTEITPIMAWEIIEKQEYFSTLTIEDFDAIAAQLSKKMRCFGYGAVLQAEHVWNALLPFANRTPAALLSDSRGSSVINPVTAAALVRLQCRSGTLTGPTAHLAPGHTQANLLVLPSAAAADFRDLCERNPVICPKLAISAQKGEPASITPSLYVANAFDLRTDLPKYNVYRSGVLMATKSDIFEEWDRKDHVAFLIGCSFSFESALHAQGLTPRHRARGSNVSMFTTSMRLHPAGIFTEVHAIVSMRPYLPEDIPRVRDITRPFFNMHGEPLDWGWNACARLGINDIQKPEFGDPVEFLPGEVPVFWGCGVTPQAAVMAAGDKIQGLVMAQAPGHMLVLDSTDADIQASREPLPFFFDGHVPMQD